MARFSLFARNASRHARRVALCRAIRKLLVDDYFCWTNVPVGPWACYPDLVVLHPPRGILVLEFKDWELTSLRSRGIYGLSKR